MPTVVKTGFPKGSPGDSDPVTGKRKRSKATTAVKPTPATAAVHSALTFASDVAAKLKRDLTAEETAQIMTAIQQGTIKLSVGADEWNTSVQITAEQFDPLGGLGLIDTLPPMATNNVEGQSAELKRLIRDDAKFLEKLDKFAKMTDKDLGDYGRPIIEKMGKHRTQAIDHLKAERKLFRENLAFWYETKMRLLNPKFRPDLAGAKGRSVEDNLRNFGAADWTDCRAKYVAYSLSQADQLIADWVRDAKLLPEAAARIGTGTAAAKGAGAQPETEPTTAPPNRLDAKAAKAARTAYKADRYDDLVGLLVKVTKDMPAEKVLQTVQRQAKYEYEQLSEEEAKKLRKPLVLVKESTVERLGIQIAKIVVTLGNRADVSAKAQEAVALSFDLLRAAGITKVGKIEVPAKPETAEAPNGKKAASAAAAKSEESKAS
jgi:hypothetical protein